MSAQHEIIVVDVKNMKQAAKFPNGRSSGLTHEDIQMANIVILKTPTHFRAVKNRWDFTSKSEKIPNYLIGAYLMMFSPSVPKNVGNFTFSAKT